MSFGVMIMQVLEATMVHTIVRELEVGDKQDSHFLRCVIYKNSPFAWPNQSHQIRA